MDSAMMSQRPVYRGLLMHLTQLTHGAFKPMEISQHTVKNGVKLQYLFNGKKHTFTFPTKNGWFDNDFPSFVKKLGDENNLSGNFYPLPDADAYIYLTKQQYVYALNHKLLNFASRQIREKL
jgi:hypothetical protein